MPRVLNRRHHGIPEGSVYVGRPSKWGNPYKVGKDGDQRRAVELFRESLTPEQRMEAVRELKGKDLVCWCAPLPCHADVLLEIANG